MDDSSLILLFVQVRAEYGARAMGCLDFRLQNQAGEGLKAVKLSLFSKLLGIDETLLTTSLLGPGVWETDCEILPREYGLTLAKVRLEYVDPQGGKRVFTGRFEVRIEPSASSRGREVVIENSELSGVDGSNLLAQVNQLPGCRVVIKDSLLMGVDFSTAEDSLFTESPDRAGESLYIPILLRPAPGEDATLSPEGEDQATPAPEAPRAEPQAERLVMEVSGPGQKKERVFLFKGEEISFGRDRGRVDLPTWVLPCRSEEEDPDNWRSTLAISARHGRIRLRSGVVEIFDSSLNGIACRLDGDSAKRPATARTWHPLGEAADIWLADALQLRVRACHGLFGPAKGSLRIERVSNIPEHCYILLKNGASLGSAPECALVIADPDCPPRLAELVAEPGGVYLDLPESGGCPVRLDGAPLSSGSHRLSGETVLEIGRVRLDLRPAKASDFVEL